MIQECLIDLVNQELSAAKHLKKTAISKHLKKIFANHELNENLVVSKMETTATDGKTTR